MDGLKPLKNNIGIAEWQISNRCNYNCHYCSTNIHHQKYPDLKNYKIFIKKLRQNLSGKWLIILGGYGEPFAAPNFLKIIKELVSFGFYIGIITNFSSSNTELIKLCELVKGKILFFNASLHYDQINLEEFINKAKEITLYLRIEITVSIVAIPEKSAELIKAAYILKKNKFQVIFQPERRGKYYKSFLTSQTTFQSEKNKEHYKKCRPSYLKKINRYFGWTYGKKMKNNFQGKICPSAGINYFVLENNGEAYICHPYNSLGKIKKFSGAGYLGNILAGTFSLRRKKIVCQTDFCSCSTPWRLRGWDNIPK